MSRQFSETVNSDLEMLKLMEPLKGFIVTKHYGLFEIFLNRSSRLVNLGIKTGEHF
jgi:hypothetical protein